MSRINRPPFGLQQLLGSQNFGKNPPDLAQVVQPTIDLTPFYGAGLLRMESNTGSASTEGQVQAINFDGRVALVGASLHVYNALTGAANLQLGIALSNLPGNDPDQPMFIGTGQRTAYTTSETPGFATQLFQPLILEQGAQLEGWYLVASGGTWQSRLTCLYYDLEPTGSV